MSFALMMSRSITTKTAYRIRTDKLIKLIKPSGLELTNPSKVRKATNETVYDFLNRSDFANNRLLEKNKLVPNTQNQRYQFEFVEMAKRPVIKLASNKNNVDAQIRFAVIFSKPQEVPIKIKAIGF